MTGGDFYDNASSVSRAFVMSHLEAYQEQDVCLLSRDLTPGAHRTVGPKTFEEQFRPQGWSNKEYEETLTGHFKDFKSMKLNINDVLVDIKKRRSTVHSSHIWTCKIAGELVDHSMEFLWILDLNEDGSKVSRILEWVDTNAAMAFGGKIRNGEIEHD